MSYSDRSARDRRLVGTHRRIRSADLLAYKARFDKVHDDALAEITRMAQEHGEY